MKKEKKKACKTGKNCTIEFPFAEYGICSWSVHNEELRVYANESEQISQKKAILELFSSLWKKYAGKSIVLFDRARDVAAKSDGTYIELIRYATS